MKGLYLGHFVCVKKSKAACIVHSLYVKAGTGWWLTPDTGTEYLWSHSQDTAHASCFWSREAGGCGLSEGKIFSAVVAFGSSGFCTIVENKSIEKYDIINLWNVSHFKYQMTAAWSIRLNQGDDALRVVYDACPLL